MKKVLNEKLINYSGNWDSNTPVYSSEPVNLDQEARIIEINKNQVEDYPVLKRLNAIRRLKTEHKGLKIQNVYKLLCKKDLYILAYERTKSNPGSSTPGTGGVTLDSINLDKIQKEVINKVINKSYRHDYIMRTWIPKPGKNTLRPIGISNPMDRILQGAVLFILEAVFEPIFHNSSHGFRPKRGCHSALKQVQEEFRACIWVLEGDIKGAFDNVHHEILLNKIREHIDDEDFITLIRSCLKVWIVDVKDNSIIPSLYGTPQGSFISPILYNIYKHSFDEAVQVYMKENFKKGIDKTTGVYKSLTNKIDKISKLIRYQYTSPSAARFKLIKKLWRLRLIRLNYDPKGLINYDTKLAYVRYADDFVIGINGPKSLAIKTKEWCKEWISKNLALTLSDEKTLITNIRKDVVLFLGYHFKVATNKKVLKVVKVINGQTTTYWQRTTGYIIKMYAPKDRILDRLKIKGFIDIKGETQSKLLWIVHNQEDIIRLYSLLIRGLLNYYSGVDNRKFLSYIYYLLKYSCLKTLAQKYNTSIRKLLRKYGPELTTQYNKVRYSKDGGLEQKDETSTVELPKYTSFKKKWGISINPVNDNLNIQLSMRTRSKLLFTNCCICGSTRNIEMHHIRHVRKGVKSAQHFNRVLALVNRKQIPVCKECHYMIHKGIYDDINLANFAMPKLAKSPRPPQWLQDNLPTSTWTPITEEEITNINQIEAGSFKPRKRKLFYQLQELAAKKLVD